MSSLAVVTVAHPIAAPYLGDMAASLREQTDRDFVVIIVDDGCGQALNAFSDLKTRVLAAGSSPADNRRIAIAAAIDAGFTELVLADADDTFSVDRVARCRVALAEHALVFNDLLLHGAPVFGQRLMGASAIESGDIVDGNCLGLSNTAARAEALSGPARTIGASDSVVDWALFTRTLLAGHRAVFLPDVYTHYRRHSASVGTLGEHDGSSVLRALAVKAGHYRALASEGPAFAERALAFEELLDRVTKDNGLAREYVRFCRMRGPAQPFWWEIARRMP